LVYCHKVKRLAALGVALVIAMLFVADPVSGPDGCTDSPLSKSAHVSVCIVCQRGIVLNSVVLNVAPTVIVESIPPSASPRLLSPLTPRIDHPPRTF
jgi:hypothetical protein